MDTNPTMQDGFQTAKYAKYTNGIELRGDGRQALIIDGRGHHLALRAVKPFAQPHVIHVIIFHARRSLQTATAADGPVASPARTVPRRCEKQFLIPPKD